MRSFMRVTKLDMMGNQLIWQDDAVDSGACYIEFRDPCGDDPSLHGVGSPSAGAVARTERSVI